VSRESGDVPKNTHVMKAGKLCVRILYQLGWLFMESMDAGLPDGDVDDGSTRRRGDRAGQVSSPASNTDSKNENCLKASLRGVQHQCVPSAAAVPAPPFYRDTSATAASPAGTTCHTTRRLQPLTTTPAMKPTSDTCETTIILAF
jgi:hypothetical protein